jgi:hypothetical protein
VLAVWLVSLVLLPVRKDLAGLTIHTLNRRA